MIDRAEDVLGEGWVLADARIGFLGPGSIGAPMVRRLVAAGAQVAVCVRRTQVQAELERAGATVVGSVGDAVGDADVVVSCLYSDEQLNAVSAELLGAIGPRALVVSHTTGSPVTLRAIAQRLPAGSHRVVDAPFSGTADDVAAGRLTVMLGGTANATDRAEQVVRSYASNIVRTGALGSALLVKLVNNAVFAANAQLAIDVARLGADLGLPSDVLLSAVQNSSGATRAIEHMSRFPDPTTFATTIRPYLVKDVAVCHEVAQELGADLGLLRSVIRSGSMAIFEARA